MRAHEYVAHVSEIALEHGVPLYEELDGAAEEVPFRVPWSLAADHARHGNLSLALSLLPLPRLASAAALIEPRATAEVARRLRALPTALDLAGPTLVPLVYLSVVLLFQFLVLQIVITRVMPVFFSMPAFHPFVPLQVASIAVPVVLVGLWTAWLISLQTRSGGEGMRAKLFELVRGARLLTAAAALARHGRAPAETLPRLAGAAGLSDDLLRGMVGDGPLDADTCDELARWLEERARRRFAHIAVAIKTSGSAAALLIAALLVLSVYVPLAGVHRMSEGVL